MRTYNLDSVLVLETWRLKSAWHLGVHKIHMNCVHIFIAVASLGLKGFITMILIGPPCILSVATSPAIKMLNIYFCIEL